MFYKIKFNKKIKIEKLENYLVNLNAYLEKSGHGVMDFNIELLDDIRMGDAEGEDTKKIFGQELKEFLNKEVDNLHGFFSFGKDGQYKDLLPEFKKLVKEFTEKKYKFKVEKVMISDSPVIYDDDTFFVEIP